MIKNKSQLRKDIKFRLALAKEIEDSKKYNPYDIPVREQFKATMDELLEREVNKLLNIKKSVK